MVLWRHECSRYASSSRIGYHPNHPSASHPSSRPSSAATALRPFSAGRVPQPSSSSSKHQQHKQRASSALPRRLSPFREGGRDSGAAKWDARDAEDGESALAAARASGGSIGRNRPRSAIPRLGAGAVEGDTDDADDELLVVAGPHPERGLRAASAARSEGGVGEGNGNGIASAGGRRMRSTSTRSQSSVEPTRVNLVTRGGEGEGEGEVEEVDEFLEEIYEDLDDEDDGELDNRISIMESRFSTVGRERPDSTVGDGGANGGSLGLVGAAQHRRQRRSDAHRATVSAAPRSATSQRPPRAPLQQQRQLLSAGSRTTRRQFVSSARAGGPSETGDGTHGTQQVDPAAYPSTAVHDDIKRPPRVVRSRPTSAPVDGSVFDQDRRGGRRGRNPMAPLHARWRRLQMSAGARNGEGSVAAVGHGQQQQRTRSVRDVSGVRSG